MFPSFPHLAETIAAERAADLQREAAGYRRARGIKRTRPTTARAGRTRRGHSRGSVRVARPDSFASTR